MKKKAVTALSIVAFIVCVLFAVDYCANWSPYYKSKSTFFADESRAIFFEHQEKFEYIVEVLKKYEGEPSMYGGYQSYNVGLTRKKEPQIVFYRGNSPPIDVGYVEDEKFEEYLKILLIDNKLGMVTRFGSGYEVHFGINGAIRYNERIPPVSIDLNFDGSLTENWYFHVHTYS